MKTKQQEALQIDYGIYQFEWKEYLLYGAEFMMIILLFAYTFYRSYIAVVLFLPGMILLFKRKKRQLIRKRKQRLRMEFKEAISAVSSGLSAGYSIENAFVEAIKDMDMLYGSKGLITMELQNMERRLSMNHTLESCLYDLAERSGVDDIRDFTAVFTAAKRNSGSLIEIICNTVSVINDKTEIKREIEVLISAKQLEQKIMNVIPFFIVLYVGSSTGSMMDSLYHNAVGITVMTICMAVYLFAIVLSEKIVDIQV
ncbi:MAG: type II secretion system F family protein [bacterium]|nr:type II secretion system F family protein [bacterium]